MREREDDRPTPERESITESAGQRGADDRRASVRPGDAPAPTSPAPDRRAIEEGEDILERVKPY